MFSVLLDKEKTNSFHIMKTEKNCSCAGRYLWTVITWPLNQAISQKHFTFKSCIYSEDVMSKFLNDCSE